MTVAEVGRILDLLVVNYGQGQRMTDLERGMKIELWAVLFAEDDYETVRRAVLSLIKTNRFMPNVAEVRERMKQGEPPTRRISAVERLRSKRLGAGCGDVKALGDGTGGAS